MALAMGVQVAVARLGTALAMSTTIPLTKHFGSLSSPILLGLGALCIGLLAYLVFCVMDQVCYICKTGFVLDISANKSTIPHAFS